MAGTGSSSSLKGIAVAAAVLAAGGLGWTVLSSPADGTAAPVAQQQSILQGTMENVPIGDLGTRRFRFGAGSRFYWHTHNFAPQVLMMEDGKGRVQERGGPLIELLPNQPWIGAQGIEHWHGGAPDMGGTQINMYDGMGIEGSVTWGDSVSNAVYNARAVPLGAQNPPSRAMPMSRGAH